MSHIPPPPPPPPPPVPFSQFSDSTPEQALQRAQYLLQIAAVMEQSKEIGDEITHQDAMNMRYRGVLPVRLADGTFTNIYAGKLSFSIAGINYRDRIADYLGTFVGYVVPEPENEYDPDALAIYHSDGYRLGYIPADSTDYLRVLFPAFPVRCWGTVGSDVDYDFDPDEEEEHPRTFFFGTIYIDNPSE